VRRFVPALRRVASELRVPEPIRSRILLEMAADLEALYDHFRAQGIDEDEATRLTEERILASPEALRDLVAVHTTLYQRVAASAAGRLRWGFDLLLFATGVVPMIVLAAAAAATQLGSLGDAPLLAPILALAAAVAALSLGKAFQLFVRRERSTARLYRGLPTLVWLGALGAALGTLGFFWSVHSLAIALATGAVPEPAQRVAAEQVARDGTLCLLGLLLAFAAGLVWSVLVARAGMIEQQESATLLAAG
jgi:hypothetical protein